MSGSPTDWLDEAKTLKVALPRRLHVLLRSYKILTGTTMADTVETALYDHFDEAEGLPDAFVETVRGS